jgi:hypothetical protein
LQALLHAQPTRILNFESARGTLARRQGPQLTNLGAAQHTFLPLLQAKLSGRGSLRLDVSSADVAACRGRELRRDARWRNAHGRCDVRRRAHDRSRALHRDRIMRSGRAERRRRVNHRAAATTAGEMSAATTTAASWCGMSAATTATTVLLLRQRVHRHRQDARQQYGSQSKYLAHDTSILCRPGQSSVDVQ